MANERFPALTVFRCANDHVFFYSHATCPLCESTLEPAKEPPDGTLVSRTMVRISPTGAPFPLGLARIACGARTLCLPDEELIGDGTERVVLYVKDGVYRASVLSDGRLRTGFVK